MNFLSLCLFVSFVFLGVSAHAENPLRDQKISIAYADNWAPISQGEYPPAQGLLPARMEVILSQHLKMKVSHIPMPWGRAQNMVEMGNVDAFVTTSTPKRLEYAYASNSKVFFLPFVAAVKKSTIAAENLKDPDDLSAFPQRTFCDVLGNGWADYFYKDKPVRLFIVPTIMECLKLLDAERVDGIIHAAPVLQKYVQEMGLSHSIEVRSKPSKKSPNFSLLLSKKSPLGKAFLDQFDQHFQEKTSCEFNK